MAEGYVEAGANVVVGRDCESCKKTKNELRELGREALAISANVSRLEDLPEIVQQTVACFGALDVLVNDAAIGPLHEVEALEVEVWDHAFDLNSGAPFSLSARPCHTSRTASTLPS
jgi:NAD(P)-dependent dehydrogenase (short-subunit alcohol dehydrogenase family)